MTIIPFYMTSGHYETHYEPNNDFVEVARFRDGALVQNINFPDEAYDITFTAY